ncbi:hypothetical protein QBC34DRAFT_455785 [Podospora aff. communis PSN243]|uniref:Uncharacterized protein n=1 Tax=Podospora aff. communis PSN243 TaxID=3040156 RepID=A0AAV9GWI4_9PEZI|nr:hypothetical protein QBC34DRAFT_455785 [Podospora aff. communis PSN243]
MASRDVCKSPTPESGQLSDVAEYPALTSLDEHDRLLVSPPPTSGPLPSSTQYTLPVPDETTEPECEVRNSDTEEFWLSVWKWDLAALLLALGILVAIRILLSYYDGKQVPQWPLGINLNSLVAILTTLFRALVLVFVAEAISQLKWEWFRQPRPLYDFDRFDAASRGAWGSAVVLLRGIKPHNGLAAICAFLTVVSLGVGPIAQQAINVTTCQFDILDAVSTVQTARSFSSADSILSVVPGALPQELRLRPKVLAVVLNALMAEANNATVPLSCPTGNCTFNDPYASLAMCRRCEDVTSLVRPDCGSQYQNDWWAGWSLPGGLHLGGHPERFTGKEGALLNTSTDDDGESFTIFAFSNTDWRDQYEPEKGESPLWVPAHQEFVCPGDETNLDRFEWRIRNTSTRGIAKYSMVAARCSFYPCVRHYKAEVRQSILLETQIASAGGPGEGGYAEYGGDFVYIGGASPPPDTVIPVSPCTVDGAHYTLQNISLASVSPNHTISFNRSGERITLPNDCAAVMTGQLVDGLQGSLRGALTGSCSPSDRVSHRPSHIKCDGGGEEGAWWLSALFNN